MSSSIFGRRIVAAALLGVAVFIAAPAAMAGPNESGDRAFADGDYAEALKFYRRAARQDNAWSQQNLGKMYEQGLGVKQDYVEAVKWYRLAAENGNDWAQNALAVLYENGNGVEQS